MFALGIQIVVLLIVIVLPIVLAIWLVRTARALSSTVRNIDEKLARIERSLADAPITISPDGASVNP